MVWMKRPAFALGCGRASAPYARPYRSNGGRLLALRRYVDFYNHGRPHTIIGGLVPRAAVPTTSSNTTPSRCDGMGLRTHYSVRI